MTRCLALLFFFVYVFTATPFHQLAKVKVLTLHFEEHRSLNKKLTFYQFLCMHYAGDDMCSDDNHRDQQLPFKSLERNAPGASLCPPVGVPLTLPGEYKSAAPPAYRNEKFASSFSAFVWQPPELIS